jgi:Protein of unknown function (DUF2877)
VAARALFAGPGALRALRRGGRGAVELVLSGGAYLRLADDWLLVTEPGAPFGPLSLAVSGMEPGALHPGQLARALPGRLVIGDQVVSLERVRERRPAAGRGGRRAGRSPAGGGPAGAPAAGGSASSPLGGAPPAGLTPGLRALARGRLVEGVVLLAGRGDGLTPAGDDALVGYAAWRHAAGRPLAVSPVAEGRSSPLGLAYLRCAERGELPDAGVALLAALHSGDCAAASAAALTLRSWGASSGAAMAWGIAAGAATSEASWITHRWGGQDRIVRRVSRCGPRLPSRSATPAGLGRRE